MKIISSNLIKNSTILSVPGIISIIISLSSIPIHLNIAGSESYGNYIIFHFILMLSINLNLGIGKSTAISINNFPKKRREISFKAIEYTKNITLIIFILFSIIFLFDYFIFKNSIIINQYFFYLLLGSIITIFFISFEGIFQGNKKFKIISLLNLFFFSLSFSLPSLMLIFYNQLILNELILISISIKFLTILLMFLIIKNKNFIKKSDNQLLFKNLKINSKWITLNGILLQFYDLFDKYLIKFFLGPVALSIYSVPQQLTGKLSIISKSFSAYLLPNLSNKKIQNDDFEISLKIFIFLIPIFIFIAMPFYPFILKNWLSNSYNNEILVLTKIFSLSIIFNCASHILITKYEATKTLNKNLKIELICMPFFLLPLFLLIYKDFSLALIGLLIFVKEYALFFLRFIFLEKNKRKIVIFFIFSLVLILTLFLSFYNTKLFFISLLFIIFYIILKKNFFINSSFDKN